MRKCCVEAKPAVSDPFHIKVITWSTINIEILIVVSLITATLVNGVNEIWTSVFFPEANIMKREKKNSEITDFLVWWLEGGRWFAKTWLKLNWMTWKNRKVESFMFLLLLYFSGFYAFNSCRDRKWGDRVREWHAAKGHVWNQTRATAARTEASASEAPAPPTEVNNTVVMLYL